MIARAMSADDIRWLTRNDGLAGMSVHVIHEDPSGVMWIGTSNGVTLYNGFSMKNYALPRTEDGRPNRCLSLDVDEKGNVWAGSLGGVYRLSRYAEHFERVAPDIDYSESVLCYGDTTFVGSHNGLFMITGRGKASQVDVTGKQLVNNASVRCLRMWQGHLWLTMRDCLYEIDIKHGFRSTCHPLPQPSGLDKFDGCAGKLFVGTKNNGIYVYNPKTKKNHHLEGIGNVIADIHAIGDTALCVGSNGMGALLLDGRKETVKERFGIDEIGNNRIPTNAVYTYIRTSRGLDWIGYFQSGLTHGNLKYPIFEPYSNGKFSTLGLRVSSTYTYGSERLIGIPGGFYLINESDGSSQFVSTDNMGVQVLVCFCRHGDYYYIGSYDSGVLRMHVTTHALSRVPSCKELEYASILNMTVDNSNRLWLVSSEGLFRIDSNGLIRRFTENNSQLPASVNRICFDTQGNGWIGSNRGLCVYLAHDEIFKTEGFPQGFFNNQPGLKVTNVGNRILAWNQTSVFYTDSRMKRFGEINVPDFILGEICFDIIGDEEGGFWIVTDKGLSYMDRDHNSLHMPPNTGLLGRIITMGTLGANEHSVWVGTDEGLMIASKKNLASIRKNCIRPNIIFDSVIDEARMMTPGEIMCVNDKREIRLLWNLRAHELIVMPTILDYSEHDGVIFQYRIDDGEWQNQTIDEIIKIKRLSLGRHTLDMRISGLSGSTITYAVYVYPSTAFYIEAVLFLLSFIMLWWWYTWRRNTKTILQEHIETENALIKEMHDMTPEDENVEHTKYQKNRVNDRELKQLFQRMDEYVQTERPYLRRDLKMSDIASGLGVSPSLLSQVFTLHLHEPYYDYINKYRLKEFKRLIAEDKHKQFTIAALSEQCGFKKSSFFSTFRKIEGTTPTDYISQKK